jgi:hypothetical protein
MRKFESIFAAASFTLLAAAACSAGGDGSGTAGIDGGTGGGAATGGVGAISSGGSSATGTSSGVGGGSGGSIQVGGSSGDTAAAAGSGMSCNSLTATSTLLIPTVLILVDNSSSMFEGSRPWDILYNALMDPTNGAVKPLENDIRFGFTSYKGHQASGETDPACATMTPEAPTLAFGNYAAIDAIYSALGDEPAANPKWETPTGFAVTTVTPELVAFNADPPGPKFILLVTDGNPNTCKTKDPQCGQDRSIKAIQDAYLQGIGTFVIGIGDIVAEDDPGCLPDKEHCGEAHLQDVANAGAGLPVAAPPDVYKYEPCIADEGGVLTATYATEDEVPGTAPYFATNDGAALRQHLTQLLSSVATCTFDLDAIVTGDPTRSLVTLNGSTLSYGDTAGGWTLEDNHYQVTLQGSACETYRAGDSNEVHIEFFCDPTGKPIAEPR